MRSENAKSWDFDCFRLESVEGGRLWKDEREIHLKPKEAEVLRLLVEAKGQIVSRSEMLERAWEDTFVEEGNINYTISCIRKKLRRHGTVGTEFIRTVPKTGYRFVAPVQEISAIGEERPVKPIDVSAGYPRAILLVLAVFSVFLSASFGIWLRFESDNALSSVPIGERTFKSVVVLPPIQLPSNNVEEDDRLIRMSLADAIGGSIAQWNVLAVRPLSSTLKFESSGKDEIAFARELNADAVLAGTYLREGGVIRLNLRLLDSRDGAVIWAETVDVREGSVFELQESVRGIVTQSLGSALNVKSKTLSGGRPTADDEAYELYLRGKYYLNNRKFETSSAIDLFRRATALDPEFAEAWIGLAEWLAFKEEPGDELDIALQKGLTFGPKLADAWAISAFVKMFNKWDWEGAESDLQRALKLDPNNVKARHWYGTYLTLTGDFKGAREQLTLALQLDPSSMFVRMDLAELLYFEGRFDEAEEAALQLTSMQQDYSQPHILLAKISLARSRPEKFIGRWMSFLGPDGETARKLVNSGAIQMDLASFAKAYYRFSGCTEEGSVPAIPCAEMLLIAGERRAATEYLRHAVEKEIFLLPFVGIDPLWDELREDPAFAGIVAQMRLHRD